jgi:hypothetical protein
LNQTVVPIKNRRLDEFYNNNIKVEKRPDPNRSAFISLNDMLNDLESSGEAITAKFVEQQIAENVPESEINSNYDSSSELIEK